MQFCSDWGCLLTWLSKVNWAGWAQAVGTMVAIIATAKITRAQFREELRQDRIRAQAEADNDLEAIQLLVTSAMVPVEAVKRKARLGRRVPKSTLRLAIRQLEVYIGMLQAFAAKSTTNPDVRMQLICIDLLCANRVMGVFRLRGCALR